MSTQRMSTTRKKLAVAKPTSRKIKSLPGIMKIVRAAKRKGKIIVTANGCFDIIHPGHVQNLEWARAQGDILVVGINSDKSVRAHKGPGRPINSERDRALVLAGLEAVDRVFIFHTESPIPWFKLLKPAIHVKGAGSEKSRLFRPEEEVIEKNGGRVLLAPMLEGWATTRIIEKIRSRS